MEISSLVAAEGCGEVQKPDSMVVAIYDNMYYFKGKFYKHREGKVSQLFSVYFPVTCGDFWYSGEFGANIRIICDKCLHKLGLKW